MYDVEAAFLNANPGGRMYIKIPNEMVEFGLEAMFMNQLLNKLFRSNMSTVVYRDNQGALYLVKNRQVSQRTKHINICQHFVRDLQRQKKVIGQFV